MSAPGAVAEQDAILGAPFDFTDVSLKLFGPDVDEQQMLVALKYLKPTRCPLNKKGSPISIPQSYKKLTSLQVNQLQSVQRFWTGLTSET